MFRDFRNQLLHGREKLNPQTFLISESGFNPYLTVVIVHEDTLKSDPEMVKGFVEATRLGWEGYVAHPETTNALMQKLNPSMDLETFNQAAVVQKPFIETSESKKKGLGTMTEARWQKLYDQMVQLKLVKAGMKATDFF